MNITTSCGRRPRGYRITVELTGEVGERYPELTAGELTDPVALVVELGDARRLDLGQLAYDLRGLRLSKAVVAHEDRAHGRHVRVLDVHALRTCVAESADAGRMLRLERSIKPTR
ncbi:hypothetical protein AF335_33140 [Streptomyces eurocidicus]|uniref:Uncharacterized protein n=1 Tax=Streptomyces eurocidicus TaxID=66423 RepID=A0A2N8NLZ9_STREU|nr:hypothetical protein [Streptomyces eurocidicus]MBB5123203.1 hypothetical protein [Streptomyces eurocidicus]MBF6055494.1 hypothetical protein [Streptomyces eurocidicus]PNE29793.1 hypothetical protein AF335_33140 [Streptomyces eurocidicus]